MNEYDAVRSAVLESGVQTPGERREVYKELTERLQRKISETSPAFRSVLAARLRLLRQATKDFEQDILADVVRPPSEADDTPLDPSVPTIHRPAPRAHPLGRIRTIAALTMRFLRHLSRIGPAAAVWIFVEPIIQMSIIVAVYTLIGATTIMDMEPLPFVILGVGCWIFFRITVVRTASMALEPGLVLFPRVRLIDITLSRALSYMVLYSWAVCFFLVAVSLAGRGAEIENPAGVLAAWVAVLLFSLGLGLVLRGLIGYVPLLLRFTPWIVRIFFYTGGVVFVSEQLPDFIAKWMLLNPLFDSIQSMRSAYFTTYESTESSLVYSYVVSIVLIAVGLTMLAGRLSRPKP